MIFLTLVFCCMVAGSFACNNANCADPDLQVQLQSVNFLPNEQQLESWCPRIINMMECAKTFLECSEGKTLEEMAASNNSEGEGGREFLGTFELVRDVCDKKSSFHSDYIASVSCYREHLPRIARNCDNYIELRLRSFLIQLYIDEGYLGDNFRDEYRCLKEDYNVACTADNLLNTCGNIAHRQGLEFLERFKDRYEGNRCKYLLSAKNLKTKLLDFLELDEQKRSRFQRVFDLLRKRR